MYIERQFGISCPNFGGYVVKLVVNNFNTLEQIVAAVLEQLKVTLASHSFQALLATLESEYSRYHIHSATIEDILLDESGDTYYVCNHGACARDVSGNNITV